MAQLNTSLYTVEVRDQYGRLVTVLTRPLSKSFALYRNKPGSCQFTLDLFDPQTSTDILKVNQYSIVFRRQGTPVFAGQISYLNPTIDGDTKKIEVIATGLFDLFGQRQVNPYFPNYDTIKQQLVYGDTDSGAVIDSLIQNTQFPLQADGTVKMQDATPTLNQSFFASGSTTVDAIKLLLLNTTATGNMILGIYQTSNNSDEPSTTLVANSQLTIPVATITNTDTTTPKWNTFTYSVKPTLVAGTKYWIKTYLDTTQTGSNGISWSYLNGDYYANGKAYSPQNPSLFSAGQDLQFFIDQTDNSYQMTKNTYLSMTAGLLQTSYNINRTYSRNKIIKEAVEEISKIQNGIDFNIATAIDATTNLMTTTYNVFYPRQGINNTSLQFAYPGNIIKFRRSKDGKSMVNYVTSRGQGQGIFQVSTVSLDTTSIQTYGLREEAEDFSDIPDSTQLQVLGNELIRVRKDPLEVPEITLDGLKPPFLGSYGLGDTINIQITGAGMLNLTSTYRIEEISVTISDDDYEEVNLGVSLA